MSVYANRPTASSYSSRYADDDLDSEEEEEERRLSEQYGEAGDDSGGAAAARNNSKNNKRQANTHMTEEDAAAAKEFEEQVRAKKKKKQTTLEPIHLKSAKGLIYIRRSFPTQVIKYRHPPKNTVSSLNSKIAGGSGSSRSAKLAQKIAITSQINAAASYSRSLISAYHDFARELLPTVAPEDVYLKIEDLGSKKEIKDYLQLMRDEFRKEYLIKIYGNEKTERILNELEYGLRSSALLAGQQQQQREKYDDYDERANVVPRLGYAVTNDDDDDNDMGVEFGGRGVAAIHSSTIVTTAPMANPYRSTTNEVTASLNDETAPTSSSSLVQEAVESNDVLEVSTTRNDVDMPRTDKDKDDDDDEEEATFEEDDTVTATAKVAIGVHDTQNEEDEKENEVEDEVTVPEIEMDGAVLPVEGATDMQFEIPTYNDLTASTRDDIHSPCTEMCEKDKDEEDDDDEATFEDDDTVTATKNPCEKEEEGATVPEVANIDNDARSRVNEMDCAVLPVDDFETQLGNENTQSIVDCDKTQETLTLLMESQFDDYSQDESFSQVDGDEEIANKLIVVAPTQTDKNVNNDGPQHSQQDDGFSQTQESRFSQTQGVMFEEDVSGNNNVDEDEGTNPPCFELGQTETQ